MVSDYKMVKNGQHMVNQSGTEETELDSHANSGFIHQFGH